ncbi:hypothetical protein C8P63_11625 [Melghirimyces profundicolus]|uniref:Uncharacterized protein n=1 Tax=Melghirimyces profundicolus TaxID=1242148 RepID=A0A2T6BQT6_9BACL|nr:hypothetical protein [Melghirimyces profundicolus]PTX58438.1 hypothetical protein C8P63_11625 [Melghirimyces profundicolus]
MKRSILSALMIGSAAWLFGRSHRGQKLLKRMMGRRPRWMRKMGNMAFAGIASRVFGRNLMRRFGR